MINATRYGLDKAVIRSFNGLSITFNNGHLNALFSKEMKSSITQSDAPELIGSILDIEYENISDKTLNDLAWKSGE